MMYNLAVSVVLFNTDVGEIQKVQETILESKLRVKLFFIDNSPTSRLKKFIPTSEAVTYIHTGKNLGFGAGHNVAINQSKTIAEFHLVLNADVDFKAAILEEMYAYMKVHQEVGLMAPRIFNPDGSIQYSVKLLPTPANLIMRRYTIYITLL